MAENIKKDIERDIAENIEKDVERDIAENIEKDVERDIAENIEMDIEKNIDEQTEEISLEELFGELDDILAGMEDRDVSLEDAFSLYERGMKKIRQCNEKLDLVEKKMLVIANDGTEVPFD